MESRRHRTVALALCVVAYFGIRYVEFAISPVLSEIKTGLGVTTAVVGVGVTGSTLTYALAQLPSGVLGDRFGERTVVVAALALSTLGGLLLALSPTGAVFVAAWTLLGFAGGIYYTPATSLLTDLFERTGRAIGVHRIGGQVVGFTAPMVVLLGAVYGWRAALLSGTVVAGLALVGFIVAVRPRNPVAPNASVGEQLRPERLDELFSRPSVAFTTAVACLGQFADTATFSYLPLILQEYHGFSLELSGVLYTTYFAALTAVQPATGWLSDRVGRDPTTATTLAVGVVGYVLLVTGTEVLVVAAAIALVGIGMGWNPPVQARFVDHLAEDERGTGFGIVRAAYIGFAAFNGIIVGAVETAAGWPAALGVLGTILLIAVVALGVNQVFGLGL